MNPIKLLFLTLLVFGIVSGCNDREEKVATVEVKGDVSYGGAFRFQFPERIESLNPLEGTNLYSRNITYQIFETLLRTDLKTMRPKPHLAKSCEVDSTGKIYTLTLRNDVYFHPDECFGDKPRKMVASDVKFSLQIACSNLPINKMSHLLVARIAGAKRFFQKSTNKLPASGVSGIKVLNDTVIQIQLVDSYFGFKDLLSHPNLCVLAPEVYEAYKNKIGEHPIGTGPFKLKELSPDKLILAKNHRYWKKDVHGNRLPYLNRIELSYSPDKKKEFDDFQKSKIDCVLDIPVDQINYLLGTLQDAQRGQNVPHQVISEPSMSVLYIGFATQSNEFKDPRVRRAFNLVVDRNKIVNQYLGGEGWPSMHGFIPPLDFYPNDDVTTFETNIEEAQKLLAQAGYPMGKNFPELQIWVNAPVGTPNYEMTRGFIDQINENLNVKLQIRVCNIFERDKAISTGEAKIWRAGWIADYPNPESFLSLFYSGNMGKRNSTINAFRYQNREFDQIFESANKEKDEIIRNQLYVMCDQIIANQSVVVPILTEDFTIVLNDRIRNFQANSLEVLDLSTIFIKDSSR